MRVEEAVSLAAAKHGADAKAAMPATAGTTENIDAVEGHFFLFMIIVTMKSGIANYGVMAIG